MVFPQTEFSATASAILSCMRSPAGPGRAFWFFVWMILVNAFCGEELLKRAYETAIRLRYRFYSFGDCMMLL